MPTADLPSSPYPAPSLGWPLKTSKSSKSPISCRLLTVSMKPPCGGKMVLPVAGTGCMPGPLPTMLPALGWRAGSGLLWWGGCS
jgi:hypothetical protein